MTKFRAALASIALATGLLGGISATGLLDGGMQANRGGHYCC